MNLFRVVMLVILALAVSPAGILASAAAASAPDGGPTETVARSGTAPTSETRTAKRCQRGSAFFYNCNFHKSFPPETSAAFAADRSIPPGSSAMPALSGLPETGIFRPPRPI